MRLQQFGLGADHQLPDPLPRGVDAAAMVLSLGYEDDDFSDNGYDLPPESSSSWI